MNTENPSVVFPKPGEVVLENREVPTPAAGEVLIETTCSLISTGTELTMMTGNFPPNSYWAGIVEYPMVPGYCNVGKVVAVGPDVDPQWLGQRVGNCAGHAKYVVFPAKLCRPIPDGISDESAAFFCISEIVMQGVRRSQIRWGESAVIYGLGLLGQFAVQLCRIAGATPVVGVDVSPERLAILPDSSGVIGINAVSDDVVASVRKATRDRKADVVFEVTGDQKLIPGEFKVLRNQGRFVILGSPRGETVFDFHDLCGAPSFTIIGSHNFSHPEHGTLDYPWTSLRDAELFFDYVSEGSLDLSKLISHRASWDQACDLYRMLLTDRSKAMGVILKW